MKLEYDTEAHALDIALRDAPVVRTVEIDSGTLVDLAEDGSVVAIEVINPTRSWPLQEILDSFDVDEASVAMLEALWPSARNGGIGVVYPSGARLADVAFAT
jgi:uncharacterized protein YuzE